GGAVAVRRAVEVEVAGRVVGARPAGAAAVAGAHISGRGRLEDRAGIVADQPADLQIRGVGAADVAARKRGQDQTLIGAGEPAEIGIAAVAVEAAAAGRPGDVAGRKRVDDDAVVEADQPATGAVRADADSAGGAGLAGLAAGLIHHRRRRAGDGAGILADQTTGRHVL